jgi:CRP/FNR family cyclic AMP-dependent transcriptional regulator
MDADALLNLDLFAPLSDDERATVAAHLEERHAQSGDHLTISGTSGYFFFVIVDGTADVVHEGQVVATLGPNDFFGETAILENKRRTATVTATSAMTLAVMFGADFAKLVKDEPEIGARIHAAMEDRAAADA